MCKNDTYHILRKRHREKSRSICQIHIYNLFCFAAVSICAVRLQLWIMVMYLLCLLKSLKAEFSFMFSSYMPSHRIIPGKCTGTEWTWNTYTLVTLSNMGSQISFITIQSLTKRALQFLSYK